MVRLRLTSVLLLIATIGSADADECADGVDLFPIKVKPSHSTLWDVEYFDNYKIATNKQAQESYLLHQCEFPADRNRSDFAAVVKIPVESVGLTQTPMLTFMEQIGARDKIGVFLTDPQYIWSPCFAQAVLEGEVAVPEERADGETPNLVGDNPPEVSDMVAFVQEYESQPFSHVVKVSSR